MDSMRKRSWLCGKELKICSRRDSMVRKEDRDVEEGEEDLSD
jgi:hypothetical protein